MKRLPTIAVLTFGLALSQLMCGGPAARDPKTNDRPVETNTASPPASANSNAAPSPHGSAKSLLQQNVGSYDLLSTVGLKEIEQQMPNAIDGVGAVYYSSERGTVQHLVVYYATAKEAYDELQSAAQRYRGAGKEVRMAVVKNARGEQVGQQLVMKDSIAEAVHWTNGPLYCISQSETGSALDFARQLPYYSPQAAAAAPTPE